MKYLIQILKVLVSFYFLTYGFLKINDPIAFSYKLNDYLLALSNELKTKQPKLEFEFKTLESQPIVFENELDASQKKIEINISGSQEISDADTLGNPLLFTEYITIKVNNKNIGQFSRDFIDSFQKAIYTLKISINQDPILIQSITSANLQNIALNKSINVQKYILPQSSWAQFLTSVTTKTVGFSIVIGIIEITLGFILLFGWRWTKLKFVLLFFTFCSLILAFYSFAAAFKPNTLLYILFLALMIFSLLAIVIFNKYRKKYIIYLLLLLHVLFIIACFFKGLLFTQFYNPDLFQITDSAHYANAIKLTPTISLLRNILLTIFTILLYLNGIYIKPWFSSKFSNKLILGITLLAFAGAVYTTYMTPFIDFTPFAKGKRLDSICKTTKINAANSIEVYYKVRKENKTLKINSKQLHYYLKQSYIIVPNSRTQKVKSPFYLHNNPDFVLVNYQTAQNQTQELLNSKQTQLWFVSTQFSQTNQSQWKYLKQLKSFCNQYKLNYVLIGSTDLQDSATTALFTKYKLLPHYYLSDQKNVLSMSHTPATLYLLHKGKIMNKWSLRNLPNTTKLLSKIEHLP